MALPTVIDFEPENDFGGSISQSQSRFRTFLAHVAPDPDDGIEGAVEALYLYDESLQRGSPHPANEYLYVSDFGADTAAKGINRNGHYLFRVVVSYTSNQYEATRTEDNTVVLENPLDDPPAWRSSFRVEMVPAEKDIHGKAVLNSADDVYDPFPMRKKVIWTHACTMNMAAVPTSITSLANAVNSGPVSIRGVSCSAETVQIVGIDIPDTQIRNGMAYVPVTFVYEVDEEGFDLEILSQGYKEKGESGQLYDIYVPPSEEQIEEAEDNDWPTPVPQRTSVPMLLDRYGKVIWNPTPESVYYTEHEITHKVSFAGLPGIPA